MKVYATGGRKFNDKAFIWATMDRLQKELNFDFVGVGDATGVDKLVWEWCKEHRVGHTRYIAFWEKYGNAAGHIRNRRGLEGTRPEWLIKFPGNVGTENCCDQARSLNINIYEVSYATAK